MSIRIPHSATLIDDKPITTANGTLEDGTGAGPYHRFVVDIQAGGTGVMQWSSNGVGSASSIGIWGSTRKSDNYRLADNLDPLTNSLWGPMFPEGFIDTVSAPSIPDGASTSGVFLFSGLGHCTLLVQVLVTVDIPKFTLDVSNKDSA